MSGEYRAWEEEAQAPRWACRTEGLILVWLWTFGRCVQRTNTGQVADDGWKLTLIFAIGQQVGNVWGASATQTGQAVTLVNLPWDATLLPGATINAVGMTGTWITSDAAPTGFAVNGVACT